MVTATHHNGAAVDAAGALLEAALLGALLVDLDSTLLSKYSPSPGSLIKRYCNYSGRGCHSITLSGTPLQHLLQPLVDAQVLT